MKKTKTCKRCFICQRKVKIWRRPYVVLLENVFAHFVCYTNARSPLVTE